jgi:energy-coupling factor transporter ATP-binding protein EcfA2
MAVDEALTVGDVEFQRRCVEKIEAIQRDGRTIIFVSHDLGALGKLCGRVVWLQKGQVRELGAAKTVIDAYLHETIAGNALAGFGDDPDAVVGLRAVRLVDRAGAIVPAPRRGDEVDLAVTLDVRRGVVTDTAFHITNDLGIRIIDDVLSDGRPAMAERYDPGRYEFRMSIPPLLAPGEYTVNFWMGDYEVDHVHRDVLRFRVLPRFDDRAETATRDRLIVPQVRWEVRPA